MKHILKKIISICFQILESQYNIMSLIKLYHMTDNGLLVGLKIEDQVLKCKYLEIMNNFVLSLGILITGCRGLIVR